jgi:hypothetical protein
VTFRGGGAGVSCYGISSPLVAGCDDPQRAMTGIAPWRPRKVLVPGVVSHATDVVEPLRSSPTASSTSPGWSGARTSSPAPIVASAAGHYDRPPGDLDDAVGPQPRPALPHGLPESACTGAKLSTRSWGLRKADPRTNSQCPWARKSTPWFPFLEYHQFAFFDRDVMESCKARIDTPSPMTYLRVRLSAGERWRYEPPRELRRFVDCPAFGIAGRGKCAGAVEVPIGGARQGTCERFGRDVEGHSLQGQSTLEHDSFADAICRHYVTAQTHLIAILSTTTRPRSR